MTVSWGINVVEEKTIKCTYKNSEKIRLGMHELRETEVTICADSYQQDKQNKN